VAASSGPWPLVAAFGSLTAFGGPEMAFGAVWRPLAVSGGL